MSELISKPRNQVIFICVLLVVAILFIRVGTPNSEPRGQLSMGSGGLTSGPGTFESGAKIDASGGKTSEAQSEYLTLALTPKNGELISATGWKLAGGKREAFVGKATSLFHQGLINETVPIVITKPSVLIVTSGRSPLGVSFRENKCTGLLASFQTFNPALSPACLDCGDMTGPSSGVGQSFPDYNACVDRHRDESDFFSNTWRIYLGSDAELWRNDLEVIRLYDQAGHLQALTSY